MGEGGEGDLKMSETMYLTACTSHSISNAVMCRNIDNTLLPHLQV